MSTTYQVIALSSLDTDGTDNLNEPKLSYPDALTAAQQLRAQGKAFRVISEGDVPQKYRQSFVDLGAIM